MDNEQTEPDSDALLLFSNEVMGRITDAERRGEYTLERVRECKPGAIEKIIQLRAQGIGQMRIAQIVGVHFRTVAAVDLAYPEEIQAAYQKRVHKLLSAADLQIEQMLEEPEKVPWNIKALAASQLYDKALVMDGRPNVRVEHIEKIDLFSDWPEFVRSLEQSQQVVEIECHAQEINGEIAQNSMAINLVNPYEQTTCEGGKTHLAAEKKSAVKGFAGGAWAGVKPGEWRLMYVTARFDTIRHDST